MIRRMTPRPPRPENRASIERALASGRRKSSLTRPPNRHWADALDRQLAKLRDVLDPESFAKVQSQFLRGSHKLSVAMRRKRRGPDDGSMPALVEPPRGPRPLQGGAAAALEFDD